MCSCKQTQWEVCYLFGRCAAHLWVAHPALQQPNVFLQLLVLLQLLHQCLLVVLLCTLQPCKVVTLTRVHHKCYTIYHNPALDRLQFWSSPMLYADF